MDHGRPDEALAAFARAQHGLVHRGQAAEAGMSAAMIDHRVASGRLEWVTEHVLRVAGTPATEHSDLAAAVLHHAPNAVASHRSAAHLHRLDTFAGATTETEITLRRRSRRERTLDVVRHTSLDLEPPDVVLVRGIPCTVVARTLLDLAAVCRARRVEHAIDGAVRDGHVSVEQLAEYLRRHRRRGRRGVAVLEGILADRCSDQPQSVLERQLLRVLRNAGLPTPRGQHRIDRPDGGAAFVDFAFPDVRVGIEVDGHGSHATRAQRAADADRANQLSLLGWQLLRFTYEDVSSRPARVAATIRRALETRTLSRLMTPERA